MEKKIYGTSAKNQYIAAVRVNLITIAYGAACGWTSPSLQVLLSDDSPLPTGPISQDESSWIAAMLSVGGLCGTIAFGYLGDRIGRKTLLCWLALPQAISWLSIAFAQNVFYLYFARFMFGFGGSGIFIISPMYITEIAEDRVRGRLGSMLVLSCNVGIVFVFLGSDNLDFYVLPYAFLCLLVLFVASIVFLPETPTYLMKTSQQNQAEKSLRYFRNIYYSIESCPDNFKTELEHLQKLSVENQKSPSNNSQESNGLTLNDFRTRAVRKGFMIGLMLMAINQFCGCFAMVSYTEAIFKESGSNLTPVQASIVVAVIQLIGSYVATLLVDCAGRRILLVTSALGTAAGFISFGVFTMLTKQGVDLSAVAWIPVASFSFSILLANFGILTLPFMIVSEIMPERIRCVSMTICMAVLWIFAFFVLRYFSLITESLGLDGGMFLFAGCCLTGALLILLLVPETKGKNFDEIIKLLE